MELASDSFVTQKCLSVWFKLRNAHSNGTRQPDVLYAFQDNHVFIWSNYLDILQIIINKSTRFN